MSSISKERLIIFTRYPETGTTKTRMIPIMGEKGAARLQREMTEHVASQVVGLSASKNLTIEICYDGGNEDLMRRWLGSEFEYVLQKGDDVGERMQQAFEDAFGSGATSSVIIGTDIPDLTARVVRDAFNVLKQKEMVLGPAKDGGYYLIGLSKTAFSPAIRDLFTGIKWGEKDVLRKTINAATGLGIHYSLVDKLQDVDRPEDLSIWARRKNKKHNNVVPTGISVIIPTLNEADHIAAAIASIGHGNNTQIIVADGGSFDDTVSIAESLGATVIKSSPPRSRQMNQGADAASKEVLLFLHADTRLPENFDKTVFLVLKQPGVAAGAFELRIDSPNPALRFIEYVANRRSRYLKMPYGDQAIFMLSEIFHQTGGFPDMPIMEDFELIRRLQKKGDVVTVSDPVVTSPRRWLSHGILKTTLINQLIVIFYFMGMPMDVIARLYRRRRGMSRKNK
ncbi:MAG: TIGR04283 family arsenosugar biosynthesis glycosyltransferase [Desulfobacterales bacterium]